MRILPISLDGAVAVFLIIHIFYLIHNFSHKNVRVTLSLIKQGSIFPYVTVLQWKQHYRQYFITL